MDILSNILGAILGAIIIYLWNRFIVRNMIKSSVNFHKKYNSEYIDKMPLALFIKNEENLYKFACGFYWFGYFAAVILKLSE